MRMDPRGRFVSILLAAESLLRAGAYYITPYGNDTPFQVIANRGPIPLLIAGIGILIANIPAWRSSRKSNRFTMLCGVGGHMIGLMFSINIGLAIISWGLAHHRPFSTAFGYLFVIAPLHIGRLIDHGRRITWTRQVSQQSSPR